LHAYYDNIVTNYRNRLNQIKLYRIYFKLGKNGLLVLRINSANIKRTVTYNTAHARSQQRLI